MLRKRFREIDILARYGGEEFVILISHADIDKAKFLFEEIRQKIENEKFFLPIESYNPVSVKQTISIGLTQIKENKNRNEAVLISNKGEILYEYQKQNLIPLAKCFVLFIISSLLVSFIRAKASSAKIII